MRTTEGSSNSAEPSEDRFDAGGGTTSNDLAERGESTVNFENHYPFLRRKARFLTGSDAAADDLVQDTFERAIRAHHQFVVQDEASRSMSERRWLSTIMIRRFIDMNRKSRRNPELHRENFSSEPSREPYKPVEWELIKFEDVIDAGKKLKSPFRETFLSFYQNRMPVDAIAKRFETPKNTVSTRLYRARKKVLDILRRKESSS